MPSFIGRAPLVRECYAVFGVRPFTPTALLAAAGGRPALAAALASTFPSLSGYPAMLPAFINSIAGQPIPTDAAFKPSDELLRQVIQKQKPKYRSYRGGRSMAKADRTPLTQTDHEARRRERRAAMRVAHNPPEAAYVFTKVGKRLYRLAPAAPLAGDGSASSPPEVLSQEVAAIAA